MYFIVLDIILIVYSYSTHKPTAHESPWARLKITLSLANEYVGHTPNLHQGLQDVSQSRLERLLEGQRGGDPERGPVGGKGGANPVANMLLWIE